MSKTKKWLAALVAVAATMGLATTASAGDPRIVGGVEAGVGEFPFMAALLQKGSGDAYQRQFCGGSLIAPYLVLTAAHCLQGSEAKDIEVAVGRTTLSSSEGQIVGAQQLAFPAEYEFPYRDVGLVVLSAPVRNVDVPLLPTAGSDSLERPGKAATVIGWGNTIEQSAQNPGSGNVDYPDRLRKVDVPLISRAECATAYPDIDLRTAVCAGTSHRDACQGDSGGPLLVKAKGAGRQAWYQIGIVSGGIGCAATGYPGFYTQISNRLIRNWIG